MNRPAQSVLAQARRPWLIAAAAAYASTTVAATLTATVSDPSGSPVQDVVIYAIPEQTTALASGTATAVIDQVDQRFVPHVLVVQTGTSVTFPNSDSVRHHVYSFSAAKQFELPLYKGDAHAPVVFDNAGIVDLGCNIHDRMEAHVLVVDTPYFAATELDGHATLPDLPEGRYSLGVYTPRLSPSSLPEPIAISLESGDLQLQLQLDERLRAPHQTTGRSLQWSSY